jgi:hypothetical protein
VRAVPARLKKQTYALYGITSSKPGDYQLDHLIPLCLGGSNSVRNLWPQSYNTSPWNAHVEDTLENRLHNLVCAGKVDLETTQHEIASDRPPRAASHSLRRNPPRRMRSGSTRVRVGTGNQDHNFTAKLSIADLCRSWTREMPGTYQREGQATNHTKKQQANQRNWKSDYSGHKRRIGKAFIQFNDGSTMR